MVKRTMEIIAGCGVKETEKTKTEEEKSQKLRAQKESGYTD